MPARAVACGPAPHEQDLRIEALAQLSDFRGEFYACLDARADELFKLTDALLCTDGPVKTLVDLALSPEHRRGHGTLYDDINHGRIVGSAAPCGASPAHPIPARVGSARTVPVRRRRR
jgi:hypothetical protein